MKKVWCLILSIIFVFMCCGCDNQNTESLKFSQEVTIVKLPSPPKCKTTDDISVVNNVIDILSQIEKHPTYNEVNAAGWSTMIRIKIDGQEFVYTLGGGLFTDSDGKQYNITNCEETEDKLTKIYSELDVPEVDYP